MLKRLIALRCKTSFAARAASAGLAILLSACASSPDQRDARANGARAPGAGDAGRILAAARAIKTKKGCNKAAPTYRVAAALGEGFEIAQAELGACLLTLDGANAQETALFEQEALFWLHRAAQAGQPAAQRALAEYYGAAGASHYDPEKALSWALVYSENTEASLFGMSPLAQPFLEALDSALDETARAAAQSFADTFKPLAMAAYAPAVATPARSGIRQRPTGGQRRRPR
ncbi:MAG: hypothetical protein AAGJ87_08750 [Pseudomonadota bacterium]